MAENEGQPAAGSAGPVPNPGDFPPVQYPTLYMDYFWSATLGQSVVKLYISRQDSSFRSDGTYSAAIFAQLVMPTPNFVSTAAYFEGQVRELVRMGMVTQDYVDEVRRTILGGETDASPSS